MTLQQLVDKHGVDAVASTCNVSPDYVKRCLSDKSGTYRIKRVKLVNATKKLNS